MNSPGELTASPGHPAQCPNQFSTEKQQQDVGKPLSCSAWQLLLVISLLLGLLEMQYLIAPDPSSVKVCKQLARG